MFCSVLYHNTYAGYGNAAGLLARRGLLQGGRGEGDFSADEESDTEDYQKEAHKAGVYIAWLRFFDNERFK